MTTLLAASEFEIVIGIIIFVIWALAAAANKIREMLQGSPQQRRPRAGQPGELSPVERMQREIAEQLRIIHGDAVRPPPLPPTPQREPAVQRPSPEPPRQRKQPKKKPPKPPRQPVFADSPPPPAVPAVPAVAAASPLVAAPLPAKPPAAPQIRRWLNPATLRQQYILTEIFQPPLCLRDERQFP